MMGHTKESFILPHKNVNSNDFGMLSVLNFIRISIAVDPEEYDPLADD